MLDGLAIAIVVTKGLAKGYVYVFEQLLRLWLDSSKTPVKPSQVIARFYAYDLLHLVCFNYIQLYKCMIFTVNTQNNLPIWYSVFFRLNE